MGSDDNKVLALKRKISKQQGTSMARQDLILVDKAEGEGVKSEDPEEGVAVVDRVALRDDAALAGACSVVLYVKDSALQKRVKEALERKPAVDQRKQEVETRKQADVPGPVQVLAGDCVNGQGKKRIKVD